MQLSDRDWSYVKKRERFAGLWPAAGACLLLLLAALTAWLWIKVPFMVNPWAVAQGLKAHTIPQATVLLMAAMLPVAVLTLFAFAAAVVLLAYVEFANERRLIRLIHQQGSRAREEAPRDPALSR